MEIAELPDDIWWSICAHLQGEDVARLGCVCTSLRTITEDETIWETLCKKHFAVTEQWFDSWKRTYIAIKVLPHGRHRTDPCRSVILIYWLLKEALVTFLCSMYWEGCGKWELHVLNL